LLKKHLGYLLPCTDNALMHENCWRLIFRKLRAMKMSPETCLYTNYAQSQQLGDSNTRMIMNC